MKQQDGSELWAIREGGACLNKKGQWEFEPIPSSRTKAFFKRCRFASVDEATTFWLKGNHHSRFEHYKARANQAMQPTADAVGIGNQNHRRGG